MSETERWLTDYGENHQDISFAGIYWIAVLTLVIGTVGMLWSLPVPYEFEKISPILNWGSTFLMAAVVYYFIISVSLAIGMLPFLLGIAGVQNWLTSSDYSALRVSIGLLVAGIIGLWMGHRNQGSLRPVLRDLQLMMIGPAWLLSVLYRRIGIPF